MDKFKLARQINRAIRFLTENLTNEQALEVPDLYPEWKENVMYKPDDIVKFGEVDGVTQLYSVIQEHTSQSDWLPNEVPAMYKAIGFDGDTPLWVQPLGATDAYKNGDVVSYSGSKYESTTDGNVWEPTVYGWVETE